MFAEMTCQIIHSTSKNENEPSKSLDCIPSWPGKELWGRLVLALGRDPRVVEERVRLRLAVRLELDQERVQAEGRVVGYLGGLVLTLRLENKG